VRRSLLLPSYFQAKWVLAVEFDTWQAARVMCKLWPFLHLSIICLILGACASETTTTNQKLSKDVWGNDLPFSIGKDDDGNPMMKSDKRSSFENKTSNLASNRDFSGNDYTKKSYSKDRWGGNTAFARKKYEGNTNADHYKKEPWYVRKQVASSGKQSTASNKKFSVNPFRTNRATEQDARRITSKQDYKVSNRRQSYKQPVITDWKDQSSLSIKDTNSMLGR